MRRYIKLPVNTPYLTYSAFVICKSTHKEKDSDNTNNITRKERGINV
jgi:hypothetical protein